MNRDVAFTLLKAMSALTSLIMRQNVVCETYVSARSECHKEMQEGNPGLGEVLPGWNPSTYLALTKLASTLGAQVVEMRSIAREHKRNALVLEHCGRQLQERNGIFSPTFLETMKKFSESLTENVELVSSRVELLQRLRETVEGYARYRWIRPQTSAFIEALDEMITAYNYHWFAGGDLARSIQGYLDASKSPVASSAYSSSPHPNQTSSASPKKDGQQTQSFQQEKTGSSGHHWLDNVSGPSVTTGVTLSFDNVADPLLAKATRLLRESEEERRRIVEQYAETKAQLGSVIKKARLVRTQALAIKEEAERTQKWLHALNV